MKIDHLTLSFRNKIILEDIDIEIKPGEFVFFIWYSWSGKTSLIRAIIWDFKPERWDVILDNNVALYKLFREDMLLNYRRSIWVIFQDYKLLESKKLAIEEGRKATLEDLELAYCYAALGNKTKAEEHLQLSINSLGVHAKNERYFKKQFDEIREMINILSHLS